jgi:hypothetical protein
MFLKNLTSLVIRPALSTLLFILTHSGGFAQPKYVFTHPQPLCSTSNCNVQGSRWRFSNVAPSDHPNEIDAIVTIDTVNNALLTDFDTDVFTYAEAFSPRLVVPGHSKGFVGFTITFVIAGTTTPLIQDSIPATPIDIDGTSDDMTGLYEWDKLDLNGGHAEYMKSTTEIQLTQNGTEAMAINIAGIDHPGIDTASRDIMYTVVKYNGSSLHYEIGVVNNFDDPLGRLKALYFKTFDYDDATFVPLPVYIEHFSGAPLQKGTLLQWNGSNNEEIRQFNIQFKQASNPDFKSIGAVTASNTSGSENYSFRDAAIVTDGMYRIEIELKNGKKIYSSILLIKAAKVYLSNISVSPNPATNDATVSISSLASGPGKLELYDCDGKKLRSKQIQLKEGANSLAIDLTPFPNAQNLFVVIIFSNGEKAVSKFFKR